MLRVLKAVSGAYNELNRANSTQDIRSRLLEAEHRPSVCVARSLR